MHKYAWLFSHYSYGVVFLLALISFFGILVYLYDVSLDWEFVLWYLSGLPFNSNYALLGSIRLVDQIISYEVKILIMISFLFFINSFDLKEFAEYQENVWLIFVSP